MRLDMCVPISCGWQLVDMVVTTLVSSQCVATRLPDCSVQLSPLQEVIMHIILCNKTPIYISVVMCIHVCASKHEC